MRFDSDYPRRTFNNHRDAVEEVFGIVIGCNRSTNRYFIKAGEGISDESAENAWLINSFTVNNMLRLSKEKLQGRVSVEDIPSGHMHLTEVMEAMTENLEVVMEYHKYTSDESEPLTIWPYAVKEFAKRWYIIAYCKEREGLRVYGLDRVKNMKVTGKKFKMKNGFDVDELFATSFGIYLPGGKGQIITFRCSEREAKFLRDLPLHSSQEEVRKDGDSVIFSIFVCPDKNLIMEICKHGSRIEILSPAEVRNAVKEELAKALAQYE
jgi:predicted DNA-binding transcriptional regulator YafY